MKTSGLMIGDKVYETSLEDTPQVVTVEEIGLKHIYIRTADDDMTLLRYEPKYLEWYIEHIEPIPLTAEILDANGFLSNGEFPNKDHIKVCHGICGNESWYVTFCEYYGFDIKYIHELQHALRLCGLEEIADNFVMPQGYCGISQQTSDKSQCVLIPNEDLV